MGDSINLAARLMCHPEASNSLLCDERTYNLCDHYFVIEKLGETMVKGKEKPINIYRPKAARAEFEKDREIGIDKKFEIIGRAKEKAAVVDAMKKHGTDAGTHALIMEGEGGQGLSTLMKFAKIEAIQQNYIIW